MSRSGDWYIKVHGEDDDRHDWGEAEADHEAHCQGLIEKLIRDSFDGDWSAVAFHNSIWEASTEILNGLEVQVVVDGLTLKPSTNTIVGDYRLNNASELELLFASALSTSSTILAIYEEA